MEPRCRIEALKARGVDVGKERLVTILRKPEARFMERYILRYIATRRLNCLSCILLTTTMVA